MAKISKRKLGAATGTAKKRPVIKKTLRKVRVGDGESKGR